MKIWALVSAMLLSVMVLLPGLSSAEDKMTGRIALHYVKTETIEVGDNVPGHILGVAQQTGLTFFSTGEVAKKSATFHFDLVKGKGTFGCRFIPLRRKRLLSLISSPPTGNLKETPTPASRCPIPGMGSTPNIWI